MAMDDVDPDPGGRYRRQQGGGLSIAAAALEPRVARAAPVFPFLTDYKRTWEMDLTVNAYQELRDCSASTIRSTSARMRSSPGSATSMSSTWRRASGRR